MNNKIFKLILIIFIIAIGLSILFYYLSAYANELYPNIKWREENNFVKIVESVLNEDEWKIFIKRNDLNPDSVGIYIGRLLNIHYINYLKGYENNLCVKNHEYGHVREEVEGYEHHTKYALEETMSDCPEKID